MAGRKKSETQPHSSLSSQMLLPSTRRRSTSSGTIVNAFCPICGRTCPENRVVSRDGGEKQTAPYFESIDWDPAHPFGLRLSAAGKGSLQDWQYINPQDAPELFEALKKRFKDAIKEWMDKGWLEPSDIQISIKNKVLKK